ncbi:MAG: alanyl-tRNA editing protein [Clostridia bacterium]
MATQRLYYDRPEALDVDATVVSVATGAPDGSSSEVLLDRTPFYPEGGGQPWDLGTIAGLALASVIERDAKPVHILSCTPASLVVAGIVPGERVRCRVDGARRRDHTEQHTAQHLLSATVLRLLGAPTKSFHLGERYSSIDVDIPVMDRVDADAVEAAVLAVVREDYRVITHLCPPEDVESFPLRRKPPVGEDILRILEIDGLDFTPCAGTHLRSTGAIHAFRILKTEKYKGMTRIYFLAGGRAQADYMKLAAAVRDTAAAACCAEDDVAQVMTNLMDRTTRLESELKDSLDQIASLELQSFIDLLPGTAGSGRSAVAAGIDVTELSLSSSVVAGTLVLLCRDRDYAGAARLAKAGAALGRTTIAVSFLDSKVAAAAATAGSSVAATAGGGPDLGKLLKPLMLAHGGKGGGSSFFQAAFPGVPELEAFITAIRGMAL